MVLLGNLRRRSGGLRAHLHRVRLQRRHGGELLLHLRRKCRELGGPRDKRLWFMVWLLRVRPVHCKGEAVVSPAHHVP